MPPGFPERLLSRSLSRPFRFPSQRLWEHKLREHGQQQRARLAAFTEGGRTVRCSAVRTRRNCSFPPVLDLRELQASDTGLALGLDWSSSCLKSLKDWEGRLFSSCEEEMPLRQPPDPLLSLLSLLQDQGEENGGRRRTERQQKTYIPKQSPKVEKTLQRAFYSHKVDKAVNRPPEPWKPLLMSHCKMIAELN